MVRYIERVAGGDPRGEGQGRGQQLVQDVAEGELGFCRISFRSSFVILEKLYFSGLLCRSRALSRSSACSVMLSDILKPKRSAFAA